MYHIVYLTTNLINQKFYVGVHSTYNLEDGYLGSGNAIKLAFKKYGKQNFKRQILHYCLSDIDAYQIESDIVTPSFISNPLTYNIVVGGIAGKSNIGIKRSEEFKQSRRKPMLEHIKQKISETKSGIKITDEHKTKLSVAATGKTFTKERCNNISKSFSHREKVKCKYCDQISYLAQISRWHNENCKHKI